MDSYFADNLPASVLYRILRGDAKGRPFGTPRNPRAPTMEEFNARVLEALACDLAELIVAVRHGLHPEQLRRIAVLPDEELIRFRLDDPISATQAENGLCLTGGHHRVQEIVRRVASGRMNDNTI